MDRGRPVHLPLRGFGNRSQIALVTVCVKERRPLLANSLAVDLLKEIWLEGGTWHVGRFVVMPDHVHLFCQARQETRPLAKWVQFWKGQFTRAWPASQSGSIWQNSFWDRQIRSGQDYSQRWEYLRQNPVRAGLVTQPEDWPWQGELTELRWHN